MNKALSELCHACFGAGFLFEEVLDTCGGGNSSVRGVHPIMLLAPAARSCRSLLPLAPAACSTNSTTTPPSPPKVTFECLMIHKLGRHKVDVPVAITSFPGLRLVNPKHYMPHEKGKAPSPVACAL